MSLVPNRAMVGAGSAGYNIQRSLRFRSSASAYLSRTPASAGNQQIHTFSGWIKYSTSSTDRNIISFGNSLTYQIVFGSNGTQLGCGTQQLGVSNPWYVGLNNVFRDPSAWYHIVIAIDTTQATAANRVKIYVNGVQQTSYASATYPTQNYNTGANSTTSHSIGRREDAQQYLDGYLAEVNFIDGQALTPSSFGQTDPVTGVWTPKKYTGTYGTNGFYLPFTDNTSATTLAYDKSGNGNNWTPNNISTTAGATYDSMTDVPTLTSATAANYCTWNPLNKHSSLDIREGNLNVYTGTTAEGVLGTIGLSSGKWYFEWYTTATTGGWPKIGIAPVTTNANQTDGVFNAGYAYAANGTKRSPGSDTSYAASFGANDIIGVALDMDAGTLTFYKNNVSQGTAFSGLSGTFAPAVMTYGSNYLNCGQRPFSYTPPTGFKALNTFNLPDPTIKKPNQYMDATLYTGNGGALTVTNNGFQPDLIWAKSRSAANWHGLWDSVRGSNNLLYSNATDAEGNASNLNMSVNSTGWSMNGANSSFNANGSTQVGWQWKGGGAAVTNTTGSISCQLSASPSSGFSVATFTPPASGTSFTIGHGLGVAPKMIITKIRNNGAANWFVYHESMGNTGYMALNAINGNLGPFTGAWNNTSPTSSVATFGSYWIGSSYNMVAYMFSEIAGFSKFGSYTGNGSTDGPFVYCGFRPKFILTKRASTAGSWHIYDTTRNQYNLDATYLIPDSSAAESSGDNGIDILSNGFKLRSTNTGTNENGTTIIFAAFAESPFKTSLAR